MGDLVYSTSGGKQKKQDKSKKKSYAASVGPVKMKLEKKGRGGKSVTVLFNLPYDLNEAKAVMKDMQGVLACGATFKDGQIEFRGDLRDKIKEIYDKKGEKIVLAGG